MSLMFQKIAPDTPSELSGELAEFKEKVKQEFKQEFYKVENTEPKHAAFLKECFTKKIDDIFKEHGGFLQRTPTIWNV